jgi:hypothetical protein
MKSWKILTYSILFLLTLYPVSAFQQDFSFRMGTYDFTDAASREFYVNCPMVLAGLDLWSRNLLRLHLAAGYGYITRKYDADRHHLHMFPVLFTLNYKLDNQGARVFPVICGGLGLMQKADKNAGFAKAHYAFTYGYHAGGSLHWKMGKRYELAVEVLYNNMIPPAMEDLGLSGFIGTAGIWIPLSR